MLNLKSINIVFFFFHPKQETQDKKRLEQKQIGCSLHKNYLYFFNNPYNYASMVMVYMISPKLEHYTYMANVLGLVGHL